VPEAARPQPTEPSSFRQELRDQVSPARATDADSAPRTDTEAADRAARESNEAQRKDGADADAEVDVDVDADAGRDAETSDAAAAAVAQPNTQAAEPERTLAGGFAFDGTALQESIAGEGGGGGAAAADALAPSAARLAKASDAPTAVRTRADAAAGAVAEAGPDAAAPASSSVQTTSSASAARADERSAPASTAAAQPGSNSVRSPGNDPLARLLDQAQVVIERSQSAPVADAVAGRLAEVESTIARARVAQALDEGRVTMTATDEASTTRPAPAAAVAEGSAASPDIGTASSQPTTGREGSVPQQIGSGGAGQGVFGPSDAGTAFSGPAADLASAGDGEPHPAAQLAAKGVGLLANQRGGAITMRLEPPALGALRIELMVRHGAVVADFTAATPEARVLLEANLGMLRERLESQGLSVERISVHGGRGTESAAPVAAQGGGDARQDGASARSDSGDRGERSGTRQDAAGGESRGRRDGEPRGGRERTDAQRQDTPRGFAAALSGVTAQRTEPMRRAG
jgi:flagellar hook-length control protein FliK